MEHYVQAVDAARDVARHGPDRVRERAHSQRVLLGTYCASAGVRSSRARRTGIERVLIAGVVSCVCTTETSTTPGLEATGDAVRSHAAIASANVARTGRVYFGCPRSSSGAACSMIAATIVIRSVVGWRLSLPWFAAGGPPRALIAGGHEPRGVALAHEVERRHDLGVEVTASFSIRPPRHDHPQLRVVGTIDDIPSIVASRSVRSRGRNLSDARGQLPMDSC